MKCIYCGHDTRYKERGSKQCGNCRHDFAFEPKTDPHHLTDQRFKNALNEVSADETRYFTDRQFLYVLGRLIRRKNWRSIPIFLVVGFFLGIMAFSFAKALSQESPPDSAIANSLPYFVFVIPVFLAILITINYRLQQGSPSSIAPVSFGLAGSNELLSQWQSVHGPVTHLIPAGHSNVAVSISEKEPDLPEYTFARVLVTDSAKTADMLIANAFHIFDDFPVLSADGYPTVTSVTLLEMLRRNPDLVVYAVHDASVAGCMLPLTLRAKEWFPIRPFKSSILDCVPGRSALCVSQPGRTASVPPSAI